MTMRAVSAGRVADTPPGRVMAVDMVAAKGSSHGGIAPARLFVLRDMTFTRDRGCAGRNAIKGLPRLVIADLRQR